MAAQRSHAKHEGSSRLGGARADFVAGLGRKVADLRATLGRVREAPEALAARDELRRKLAALGAGAKLMKFDTMERAIVESLGALDRTALDGAIDAMDVEVLAQLLEDLPALAWGDDNVRSSRVEKATAHGPTYRALVVGPALLAEALLEPPEENAACFTCDSTPDAQAAFDLARTIEPDLLVLDADLRYAAELVEALIDDPLTEAVPLVIVGSFTETTDTARYVAMGVAKTLKKPTSRDVLRAACEDALNPRAALATPSTLGDLTLAELGDKLADELRDALVARADPSARGMKIALGDGTELLGALWGAIARMREVVTARTDGLVRFGSSGPEGALTLAPPLAEVARSDRLRTRGRGAAADVDLTGRTVVVADDDPAVVWFMADLLKAVGFKVHEAFDGQAALDLAHTLSPDLVITDILMPKLDGFSLCRALRRDVALRDVPVILLSWKEDLLQRVRELGAGAAGYVRKESDTRAIVARVREALSTRARVEARLAEEGEIRGRLDGISVRSLLEMVSASRPDARISVRDASFLYEIELRGGAPVRATRTSGDGGFLRGQRVIAAVLGVGAGRFTVATSRAALDVDLEGTLTSQLAQPVARARAAVALLTGEGSAKIRRVRLDEELLAGHLRASVDRARAVAKRLAGGSAPWSLLVDGTCDASLLEDIVCDLAGRGLIVGIEGESGEELLGVRDVRAPESDREKAIETASMPEAYTAAQPVESACPDDAAAPRCESPAPAGASSLEDALIREVEGSPVQAPNLPAVRASIIDPAQLIPRTPSPPPAESTPAPVHDATIVDATSYGPGPTDETPEVQADGEPAAVVEPTPLTSVHGARVPGLPAPTRPWPTLAFVAAIGLVAWALFQYTGSPEPSHAQAEPPRGSGLAAPPGEVTYDDADLAAAGQGALEVSATGDAVVVVDGAERGRGVVRVTLPAGPHEVRVHESNGERTKTVSVRAGARARITF